MSDPRKQSVTVANMVLLGQTVGIAYGDFPKKSSTFPVSPFKLEPTQIDPPLIPISVP